MAGLCVDEEHKEEDCREVQQLRLCVRQRLRHDPCDTLNRKLANACVKSQEGRTETGIAFRHSQKRHRLENEQDRAGILHDVYRFDQVAELPHRLERRVLAARRA